ncbi:MAG: MFS transporter [Kofleriaceae bacterium]
MPASQRFEIGGRRATYVLVICSLLHAVSYADWQVMSIVLQPLKRDLGLSDVQIGVANTAYFVGIIVFTLPVSHLVDAWSRKKMIGAMALAWSACTLATGLAGGFAALLVARLGVGVGEAGFGPGGTALVSASYPERQRGQKLGVFNVFVTVGVIVGVIAGGYLSAHHGGWRTPFYVFGVPGLVLGGLAFAMQDYRLPRTRAPFVANLRALLRIRTLRWLYLGLGMYAVLQISVGTWFPSLLIRAYDLREDQAGLVMGVVSILGLAGPILGGVLADRWQHRFAGGRMRLASLSIAIAAGFMWLVLLAALDLHNRPLMWFCAAMMPLHSIFVGMALPAVAATTQDVVPPHQKGLAWGAALVALFLLGGAWGPLLVGAVSDQLDAGYRGLALGLAITGGFGLLASAAWRVAARHVDGDVQLAKVAAR